MSAAEAQQLKQAGNAAFSAGNNEEAVKCFTRAIEIDRSDHVFFSNRSAAYACLGKYEDARSDAEECVRLAPTWAKGYSRLGLALFNLREYEKAREAYARGLEIEPENASLKEGMEEVKNATERPSPFGQMFGPDVIAKIRLNPRISHFLDDPSYVAKIQMLQKNPDTLSMFMKDQQIMVTMMALMGISGEMGDLGGEEPSAMERDEEPPRYEEAAAQPSAAPNASPEPPKVSRGTRASMVREY